MQKRARRKFKVTKVSGIPIRHMGPERFTVDLRSIPQSASETEEKRKAWKSFKTLAEAKSYAEQKYIERVNKGVEGFRLTDRQRRDALDALAILGEGVTLVEAARDYRNRNPLGDAETVIATISRLESFMKSQGRRDISIREAVRKMKLFADYVGHDRAMAGIERKADIDPWLDEKGWEGVTRKNYRNAAMTLVNFYHDRMRVKRQQDDKPPSTWDVATVEQVMKAAVKTSPELVPALAVLFFAGLRPHEMMRLRWNQIDLKAGHIRLEGNQVKTGSARVITLTDNLKTWLVAYRGEGNVVKSPSWYRHRREKVMKAADIEVWPKDVTRHSFASYLMAVRKDAAYVADQLGHWEGLEMLRRHYRAVKTEADGQSYFAITPSKGGKVIKMKAG